jgi:hypothetical protein
MRRAASFLAAAAIVAVWNTAIPVWAQERVLGIDIAAWQGNLSSGNWTTLHTTDERDFVFIRSSRGGTTGFDHDNDGILTTNADCNGVSTK